MSNNRMFLLHKPSMLAVGLGKRYGWGWQNALTEGTLERFFKYLSENPAYEGSQDEFVIAMEDCSGSNCFDDWEYTGQKVDGFPLFKLKAK